MRSQKLKGAWNISMTSVWSLKALNPQNESQNFRLLQQSEALKCKAFKGLFLKLRTDVFYVSNRTHRHTDTHTSIQPHYPEVFQITPTENNSKVISSLCSPPHSHPSSFPTIRPVSADISREQGKEEKTTCFLFEEKMWRSQEVHAAADRVATGWRRGGKEKQRACGE